MASFTDPTTNTILMTMGEDWHVRIAIVANGFR